MKKKIFDVSGGILYDAVYAAKDYRTETKTILRLIKDSLKRDLDSLLDIGCGTGLHLQFFPDDVEITGIDISEEQLKTARQRLPRYSFFRGDMRDFDLEKQFDAVICMFSSIAYLHTYEEFEKAVKNIARHLKDGGVLLIEPWVTAEAWDVTRPPSTQTFTLPHMPGEKITRTIHKSTQGNLSVLDMHFARYFASGEIQEFHESHKMLLCRPEDYIRAYAAAGLERRYYEDKLFTRGIYLGIKR